MGLGSWVTHTIAVPMSKKNHLQLAEARCESNVSMMGMSIGKCADVGSECHRYG